MAEQKIENPFKDGPEFDGTDLGEQAHIFAYSLEQSFLKGGGSAPATGNAMRIGDITADAIERASLPLLRNAGYLALIDAQQVVMAADIETLRKDLGLADIAEDDERLTQ